MSLRGFVFAVCEVTEVTEVTWRRFYRGAQEDRCHCLNKKKDRKEAVNSGMGKLCGPLNSCPRQDSCRLLHYSHSQSGLLTDAF